ncbi:MAG: ribosomal RNA small subunit methyltransferase I [Aquabacterium sp.]|nr:MAG: ribosomal RNA small subunit methyltransferase I [Aquabacterium sp.]
MSAGRLLLVPNTLDLGCFGDTPPALGDTLPHAAIATAARLEHWVVENAKSARAFLKRVDVVSPLARPLQSLQLTELPRPPKGGRQPAPVPDLKPLLAPALAGADVGLLSEAGLPGVADPGAALVLAAHQAGIAVVPLSGPSSLTLALAASGLNGQSFAFVGYLPQEATERAQRLRELEQHSRKWRQTQLAIETPYRNAALLAALVEHLHADTWLSVSCGLTLAGGHTRTERVVQWRKRPAALPSDVPAVFAWLAA